MQAPHAALWREVVYALRVAVYYFGICGLLAACWHVMPPWALPGALVIVCGASMLDLRRRSRIFKSRLAVHPDTSDISPNLGKIMADLYARAGLNPADYPLYDFRAQSAAAVPDSHKSPTNMNGMAEIPTAAVLELGRPVLAVSAPLLALMDDEEERAVLAHEFVHLIESHVYWRYALQLLSSVAVWMLYLLQIAVFCAAGSKPAALALGAGVIGFLAMRALQTPLPFADKKQSDLSVHEKAYERLLLKRRLRIAMICAFGVMAFYNPFFLAVYAASWLLIVLMAVIVTGLSRTNEYRADAGIIALGASPLALMTALRKLDVLEARARGNAGRLGKGSWRQRLLGTHPSLRLRLAGLARTAQRAGISAAQIRAAAENPLAVDESHRYPLWLVQSMQAR